jgi:hypothetical protein
MADMIWIFLVHTGEREPGESFGGMGIELRPRDFRGESDQGQRKKDEQHLFHRGDNSTNAFAWARVLRLLSRSVHFPHYFLVASHGLCYSDCDENAPWAWLAAVLFRDLAKSLRCMRNDPAPQRQLSLPFKAFRSEVAKMLEQLLR